MRALQAWPAIAEARRHDPSARVPFRVLHRGALLNAGSVARDHLPALHRWPAHLHVDRASVDLLVEEERRSELLAALHEALRAEGLITGWRGEICALVDDRLQRLALIERAAARFWGALTFTAQCNGYLTTDGRVSHLWLARRAATKATDPGRLDNLVGGGVVHGQSLRETLVREAWEEAGLPAALASRAVEGRLFAIERDVPEGHQREWVQAYDLAMPDGFVPHNQDGEVAGFARLPIDEALALAASDEATVDASLVTLDFALRRALVDDRLHRDLDAAFRPLRREWPAARPDIGVRLR